jgi:PAS domain S-box-containing protein
MEHRILDSLDVQRARLARSLAHLNLENGARADLERALEALKRAEHELWLAESDLERRERRARAMIEDAEGLRATASAIELRHRELLETTLEGILRLDRTGRIIGLNDRAARLFGRRPHEMIGHPVDEFIDEDLPTLAARDLERHRLGSERPIEVAGQRQDGSPAWFAVSSRGSTNPEGTPAGALIALTDVTARVDAERELETCEGELRALSESNRVGMRDERAARRAVERREFKALRGAAFLARAGAVLADSLDIDVTLASLARLAVLDFADWCVVHVRREDGAIVEVAAVHQDPARAAFLHELLDRFPLPSDLPFAHPGVIRRGEAELVPEMSARWVAPLAQSARHLALLRELALHSYLCVPLRARGRVLGALTFATAESGRRYGAEDLALAQELARRVALAMDNARLYHEASRAQDALSEHLVTLEERIRERTAALQETNDQLAAFSFTVTHDLRAPLRAVRGFAEALLEDYGDRLDDIGRGYAERMVTASRGMDVLILDLLAYSRISRIDLVRERVDLDEVVRQALDTLEREATETGARIEVEPALPEVMGHRAALLQAVTNLLSNALKFVAAGATPQVRIRTERRPGAIRLWVEDQGIGIAPEYQERIFAPFERLHQGDRYPGTGVGLAMVRKAMERLGGAAGVESAPGAGSRFWIEVPDVPPPAGATTDTAARAAVG